MRKLGLVSLLCMLMLLTACNNSGHKTAGGTGHESGLQRLGDEAAFKRYLGKRLATSQVFHPAAMQEDSAGGNRSFSGTNLIESAADESDYIKYDGEYLFAIESEAFYSYAADSLMIDGNAMPTTHKLRIFKTHADNPGVELQQEIVFQFEDYATLGGLYVLPRQDGAARRLLLWVNHYGQDLAAIQTASPHWGYGGSSEFIFYTQNNSGQFVESDRLALSGAYQDSRIINNRLVIAHYGYPVQPEMYGLSNEEINARLEQAPVAALLPAVAVNGAMPHALFAARDCYLPAIEDQENYAPGLLYFVSLSLDQIDNYQALCILSQSGSFYASANGVFVSSENQNSSGVHYVDIRNAELRYRGSAEVPGSIGAAQFFMSEYNQTLRVVSREWEWQAEENTVRNHLSVFSLNEINEGVLSKLAELPNASRPQAIGKPGEDIYAVRFMQNKAFVVTFQRIDPFYVIDLSDPRDPYIAGELEVPGFSTLLQPLSDNLVLGVGRSEDGRKTKLELFDVSDLSAPQSRAVYAIEHENHVYSEAEWNHHALTLLAEPGVDTIRLALPVLSYTVESDENWRQNNSLHLFDISQHMANLSYRGAMPAVNDHQDIYYSNYSRAVIHAQHLYFIVDGHLWSAYWQAPDALWERGQ